MSARKQAGAGWRQTSPLFPPPPPPGSPPPSTRRLEVSLVNISRESTSPSNAAASKFYLNSSDRQTCFGASPATAFVSPARNRLFEGSLSQISAEAQANDSNLSNSFAYVPPPPPVSARPDNQPTVLDRAIEFAVSRTAEAIKARGRTAVFDEETDAQQLIDDFSAQFIELTKSEGSEEDFVAEEDEAGEDDSGEVQSMNQRLKEGSRPSPFEVWSRRTELQSNLGLNTSGAGKRVGAKITAQQWESMVDRLYASLRQHNIQLAATQQALLERELMDTTFAPRINEKSRQLAANEKSIIDRVASIEAQRIRKIQAERERFVEKERQEATFRPQINEHSRILAASTGSRLFDSPRERREAAQRKATEEREAKERINNTFSPVINNKSRELAVRGKALQLAFSPAKVNAETNRSPPRETFMPRINPESRRLAANHASRNVHERLYQDGIAMAKKLREKTRYQNSGEKNKRHTSIVQYHPEMEFIIETLRTSKIDGK